QPCRAMLAGHQALYQVGQRLDARGSVALWQPGRTRAALPDARRGPILEAPAAAKLTQGVSARALKALQGSAMPPPRRPHGPPPPGRPTPPPPVALAGAQAPGPRGPWARRPASGPSPDGRAALQQGLLRLGGRGLVTFVPRTGAIRQARAAGGRQQPAWPLGVE